MKPTHFLIVCLMFYIPAVSVAQTCKSVLLKRLSTEKAHRGYLQEVKLMKLQGEHTIKNFEGYLRDNLGDAFVMSARNGAADFVVIALGDGPEALAAAKAQGFSLGGLVSKNVGFHQIRWAKNSQGQSGFVIYRVNGSDREIHIQSFLKWLNFPGENLFTVGENKNWTPALVNFFKHLGPPPDLVVYGFAQAAVQGVFERNPVSNLPFLLRAYRALKPGKSSLKDDQSDLQGRPVHIMTLANGKRVWFFKNMYGSLSLDLVKALASYGAKNFLSLGTAGSLSEDLPVGSIFTPAQIGDVTGHYTPIQSLRALSGVPVMGNYEKVDTPNIETRAWLKDSVDRGLDAIEVELGYLINWANSNSQVNLAAALVISDILVGDQHRDMTEWGSRDLVPLRSRFTDFICQMLGINNHRDLSLKNYQVVIFPGDGG